MRDLYFPAAATQLIRLSTARMFTRHCHGDLWECGWRPIRVPWCVVSHYLHNVPSTLTRVQDQKTILEELPRLGDQQQCSHIKVAVFMVTPQFAHLLDDTSSFLKSAMSSIFAGQSPSTPESPIRSVIGIVDKLPGLPAKRGSPSACEGVAYLLAYPDGHSTESSAAADDEATVRLRIPNSRPADIAIGKAGLPLLRGPSSITVPLANTLFVNGRKTTLIETLWTSTEAGELTAGHSAQVASLNIPTYRPTKTLRRHFPLTRLTTERTVKSSMGNVLREVELDGVTVPASKELEQVIATSAPPAHADGSRPRIFATVIPQNHSGLAGIPTIGRIFSGMGFHRVTGGGGGWGQKQGLLSLDPARSYQLADVDSTMPELSQAIDGESPGFLQQAKSLANAGDRVAFWRERTEQDEDSPSTSLTKFGWGSEGQSIVQRMLVGVASTQDSVQGSTTSAIPTTTRLQHSFGILSERGLALEFDGMADENSVGDSAETQPREETAKLPERVLNQAIVELPDSWVGQFVWDVHYETAALAKAAKSNPTARPRPGKIRLRKRTILENEAEPRATISSRAIFLGTLPPQADSDLASHTSSTALSKRPDSGSARRVYIRKSYAKNVGKVESGHEENAEKLDPGFRIRKHSARSR